MYPIWPVVDRTFLIHCLGEDMKDPELSALAFAVCAATGAQLRLCSEPNPTTKFEQTSLCDRLAIEAEKRRLEYDYREGATVSGVLVPFFLHAYYTKKRRRYSSTLYIREAVTLAQLLGMDREASYVGLPPQEAHFRRKIFWLLFVTERGHSMQYGVAALLRPSVDLPQADDDKDPHLILAFLSLVRLFVAVDGMLAGEGVDDPGRIFTPESLEGLQRQLGHQPDFPPFSNEVQKTDVFITQQWMRMLLWQLSMKKVSLTASGPDNPLSLTYPDQIARDALSFLTRVSLDSVIAHGPGMELKIFEIANTLLDVINIVPSLSQPHSSSSLKGLTFEGPREVFHALSCLLSSISGGSSTSIHLLQTKIAESSVPFTSIPRTLQFHLDPEPQSATSSSFPPSATIEANLNIGRNSEGENDNYKVTGWIAGQDHHQPQQDQNQTETPSSSSPKPQADPLQIIASQQPRPFQNIHNPLLQSTTPDLQSLPAAPQIFLHHHNHHPYGHNSLDVSDSTSTPTTGSWATMGGGPYSPMTPAVDFGTIEDHQRYQRVAHTTNP